MDRRGFVKICTGTVLTAALSQGLRVQAGLMEDFQAAKLVKPDGSPLKASEVTTKEALIFAYPYNGVPCYLVNLDKEVGHALPLQSSEDGAYTSPAGVGKGDHLVAFIAICTHQLSHPTKDISFLRYAESGSQIAGKPNRIVCCAHGSVFNPAEGGRREAGEAKTPLLPVRLAYDPKTDTLAATGLVGKHFIDRYIKAFKGELIDQYGPGAYHRSVGNATQAVPLSQYSAVVPGC